MRENKQVVTAPFIVVILLFSLMPITVVSADETPTTIDMFEGGYASVDVTLSGNTADTSTTILVPRNVTFISSAFEISINSQNPSPGKVVIDVSNDGTSEWEFNTSGFGNLGHQNEFYDGKEYAVVTSSSNTVQTPGIFLPPDASIQSSMLNVSFSPDLGGGFFQIGEYQEVVESDIDGDGLPEPVFLSNVASNNSTSFVYLDYNSNGQMSLSQVHYTCDRAFSISVGDLNGDGDQDIVAFSKTSNQACVHLANGSSFSPVQNITISSGLVDAKLGDFDGDGSDDVLAIHSNSEISYQFWDNTSATLSQSMTETIMENGSFSMPANVVEMHVGDFFNNGTTGILVGEFNGHWTLWFYVNNVIAGPMHRFDGIKQNSIVTDLDGDGDLDLVGQNDIGYALQINNGTAWNTTSFTGQIGMVNSTVADFDGDGNLEIMTPQTGISDGSSSTIEGNITYRSINATSVGNIAPQLLEPWSMPSNIITMDMDNDGILEQIVAAGESSKGVFVGGWHQVSLDADGDGTNEMNSFGYAGDSANGLDGLLMTDQFNGIMDDLNPILLGSTKISFPYGIEMVNNTMSLSSTGNGQFNLTDLDIGYNCAFMVDTNPNPTGNLTNVLNLEMTPGVGSFSITIAINSTDSGIIQLINLAAIHIPGAPNQLNPPTPNLWASSISSDGVELEWTDPADAGAFAENYELFRAETFDGISTSTPYQEPMINLTIDENVTVGTTYWYQVRSIHEFGQTSNLSNLLEVTIPYPAPPAKIANLTISDVEDDMGGSVKLSWEEANETIDHYAIYLETTDYDNVTGLNPHATIGSGNNTTVISGLTDGVSYYAAIVAVDEYGNFTSEVTTAGPAYPRIDVPSSVELSMTVSNQIQVGMPFDLSISATIDGDTGVPEGQIIVSMVTSQGTYPISTSWDAISLSDFSELGTFTSEVYGDAIFYANYSGFSGDLTTRPISESSTNISSEILVEVQMSANSNYYILDSDGESDIRIDVVSALQSHSNLLEGATLDWTITNSTTNNSSSGTTTVSGGLALFALNFGDGGELNIRITQPDYLNDGQGLTLTIHPYGTEITENETNNGNNTNQPWSPTSMELVTIDCGEVKINPDSNDEITCSFNNPNNYTLDISLEPDGWSQWSDYILFEPKSGQSDFNLTAGESKDIIIFFSIEDGFENSGLSSGNIEIDFWQGPTDYTTVGDLQRTVDIMWNLDTEEEQNNQQNQNQNNTNQNQNKDSAEGGSNALVYIGAVGAIALIALIVIVVIRIRNSDIEDWSEDDLEFDQDLPKRERTNKPLPIGTALDEIEDRDIVDEAPERPDVISEFDTEIEEYEEEYTEESYEEEDSGISVDEHGTEWYEDEVGVWWYREEGQEDWEEFVE